MTIITIILIGFILIFKPNYTSSVCPSKQQLLSRSKNTSNGIQGTIFNGEQVACQDYPFNVAILHTIDNECEELTTCTGILISTKCILTAGHCCTNTGKRDDKIIFDIFADHEDAIQYRNTSSKIIHSGYNHQDRRNNLCLLTVRDPFKSTRCVKPICLSNNANRTLMNKIATFTAFDTFGGESINDNLMYTKLKIVRSQECSGMSNDTVNNICTSGMGTMDGLDTSPCWGESGGPLTMKVNTNKQCLFGVFSQHATESCNNGEPNLFVKISKYMDWINRYCGSTLCTCDF